MKTRVHITIDTECREQRVTADGQFLPAAGYDSRVWGRFGGNGAGLGIPLIMDTLERHGLRGVFFVDPFGAHSFGKSGLQEVCGHILARGHDVQLHAHPRQRVADWKTRGVEPLPDRMWEYTRDEQRDLLREGVELLVEAGVPRADVVAFRAGHFAANDDTLAAMADVGLRISSNYNPCYRERECRLSPPDRPRALYRAGSGVWELPISNIRNGGGFRHLQITALSLDEITRYLDLAQQAGVSDVVIVTHSFEQFYLESVDPPRGRINAINASRLNGVAAWLAERGDRFHVSVMPELARTLARDDAARSGASAEFIPELPPALRWRRQFEQLLKRADGSLPVRRWIYLSRPKIPPSGHASFRR